MKKIILFAIMLSVAAMGLQAMKLDLGLLYSARTVKDAEIKDVYGNGGVYLPYAALNVWKGLSFGLGYEGGYDRDGKIGLYQEDTTLTIGGLELFAAYRLELGNLSPYLKLGFGSYSYKQVVNGVTTVDDKKAGLNLAAGLRYYVTKGLFLAAEAKYVPLKVAPLEEEVDLSGLRFGAGIGYTFNL
jgi:opacity protein-like surface antigen